MNDVDQSYLEFQAVELVRRFAEDWLAAFESALASRDPTRIGALFHEDSHWRDILAFTWHLTAVEGRNDIATRLAGEQQRTGAHGFHLPAGRKPPRKVKRLGIDSIEAIFEFKTVDGRGAGIIRLSPAPAAGDEMKAWLLSTTLEALAGHEEKIGANRPTGAACTVLPTSRTAVSSDAFLLLTTAHSCASVGGTADNQSPAAERAIGAGA